MSSKLSPVTMFYVMCVTDGTLGPTFTKVGNGVKVTPKRDAAKAEAKAKAKAEELAKASPGERFYVMRTVSGHMKRPEVCSRTYKA